VAAIAEGLAGQIVVAGDIAYPSGTFEQARTCFGAPYANVLDRVIPVTGNHDYDTANAAGWKQFFGITDTYYTEQIGDWKLIILDSECNLIGGCGPNDPQQVWLAEQLASAPRCTAIAMHRPYRTSYGAYDQEFRVETIHRMAVEAKVDLILAGHAHVYERMNDGATTIFTLGTGGAGLRSPTGRVSGSQVILQEHGVLALDLAADSFSFRFINDSNQERDSGSASCS